MPRRARARHRPGRCPRHAARASWLRKWRGWILDHTDELTDLLDAAGLRTETVHGVRVFADLVPGSLLDLEPGATAALLELEQAVAERPEYLPLATQLHLLARA